MNLLNKGAKEHQKLQKRIKKKAEEYISERIIDWRGLWKFKRSGDIDREFVIGVEKYVLRTAKERGILTDRKKGAFQLSSGNPSLEHPLAFNNIEAIIAYRIGTKQKKRKILLFID